MTFMSNTTYNIKGFDLTGMGLGSCGFGTSGIGGFGMDWMNLGGFYDTNAMMGWGVANSIFNIGGGIACAAIQAHKTEKAAETKELNTVKNNITSITSDINKLTKENKALNEITFTEGDDLTEANVSTLKQYFPTQVDTYRDACDAFNDFKQDGNYYVNTATRETIKQLEREIVPTDGLSDERLKEAEANNKAKEDAIKEAKEASTKKRNEALQKKNEAKLALQRCVSDRIAANKIKLDELNTDLEEAKEKLKDMNATDIDDALNKADGTGLSRLFGGNKDTQKQFKEFRTLLDTWRSMEDGDKKKAIGEKLYKLGYSLVKNENVGSDKTTQVALSHIENWLNGDGKKYKN